MSKVPETEMRIKPSDPRYFEVALIQEHIVDLANAQIVRAAMISGKSEPQVFVAGRRMDVFDMSEKQLADTRAEFERQQEELLRLDPKEYEPTPGILFLQELLAGEHTDVELGDVDRPVVEPEEDSSWESAFARTAFADFIESLELNLD